MKKYTALPTWLLLRVFSRWLKPNHPWYKRKFTLADWAAGRTTDCKLFDFILWFQLVMIVNFICRVVSNHSH